VTSYFFFALFKTTFALYMQQQSNDRISIVLQQMLLST